MPMASNGLMPQFAVAPQHAPGAETPRLLSGCKNLHLDSKRHQPLDFQCLHTMMLLSTSLVLSESSELLAVRPMPSPSEEVPEKIEANAQESPASVDISSMPKNGAGARKT